MSKPVIAVDIDDVLCRTAEGFAAYSNATWQSNITADDYSEEWAVVWKVPLQVAIERADEYHRAGIFATYGHFEDARQVLQQLKKRYDLVIVTSRREQVRRETDEWLARHFPQLFSAVHYVGMWDSGQGVMHNLRATKTTLCKQIGAAYLIDDQIKHVISAAEAGIDCVLFGNYRWNQLSEAPPRVAVAHNWQEVMEYFHGR